MWFEAARSGDLDTLKICLFWGQHVDGQSADGRTALGLASELGHLTAVELLLERRANPNARGPGAARPLTAAVENEHWDIAFALVRAGADPNADGVASIVVADPPKRQLLALMLKRGLDPHGAHAEWGPYIHFALNDPARADLFFGGGFDLARYERETGESLLEHALSCGMSRFLHLLSLGADVELPVDRATGKTILMAVAAEPSEWTETLIRLLAKRGAALDGRDADGQTAIDHARARGNDAAVTLLTHLRTEKLKQEKQQKAEAKTRAAAEAKAARERKAAEKKAAAALRAAEAKARKASTAALGSPAKRKRRPARTRSRAARREPVEHAASAKWTPDAPPMPGSVPGQASLHGR